MIDDVNEKNGQDGKILHPDRNMMVGYVTGLCSANVKKIIEVHCIDCRDCRTQLSILLYMNICSLMDEDEQRWFADLLLLGEEAAARARSIVMRQQERQPNHSGNLSGAGLGKRLWLPRLGPFAPALTIIVLIVSGLVGYLAWSRQSSDEGTLARVREIYQDTRSLQARVTGGF